MQFTTISLVFAGTITSAAASPLFTFTRASQMCDTAPTATSTSQQALATPTASTASDCQSQCESNSQCESFVFGTTDGSSTECLLYSVPASQVPTQSDSSLKVFDKACTNVPTTDPISNSVSSSNNGGSGNGGSQTGGQKHKRDICGSAPTGTSAQNTSPINTLTNVDSATDCLSQCQQESGCESVEFGQTSQNGQNECLLFSVSASELPAPTNGESLVAYDTGCS